VTTHALGRSPSRYSHGRSESCLSAGLERARHRLRRARNLTVGGHAMQNCDDFLVTRCLVPRRRRADHRAACTRRRRSRVWETRPRNRIRPSISTTGTHSLKRAKCPASSSMSNTVRWQPFRSRSVRASSHKWQPRRVYKTTLGLGMATVNSVRCGMNANRGSRHWEIAASGNRPASPHYKPSRARAGRAFSWRARRLLTWKRHRALLVGD
jgi:hypothetical protein